jgi:hypothetical protein
LLAIVTSVSVLLVDLDFDSNMTEVLAPSQNGPARVAAERGWIAWTEGSIVRAQRR